MIERRESMSRNPEEKKKTHLPICHFPETLKHLLRRIAILSHSNHEPNETLEIHGIPSTPASSTCSFEENLPHLRLVVYEPQAR